ncbi:hypothetical protein BDAP_002720 [Binucleata daphniae]
MIFLLYIYNLLASSGTIQTEEKSLNPYKKTTSRFGEPTASMAMNSGKMSDEQHQAVEKMLNKKAPDDKKDDKKGGEEGGGKEGEDKEGDEDDEEGEGEDEDEGEGEDAGKAPLDINPDKKEKNKKK